MYRVSMNLGGKPVRKFTFDKEMVTIGRDPTCDIVIENIGASRRHAMIERTEEGYVLADLKSHNGTFVRGEKVFHHRLRDADEFLIGKYAFQFEELEPVVECDDGVPEQQAADMAADMTFRLDRRDIQKLIAQASRTAVAQLVQLAPDGDRRTVRLDRPYYVIGKDESAEIRTRGFRMPRKAFVLIGTDAGWRALCLARSARVNGAHAPDVLLNDGDLVHVRRARFRFCQG